jgi:hypothetical protein
MHPFFAYLLASLIMKLPASEQWNRFVRWVLWGQHARSFSFPPASVAMEQGDALRQLRAPSMHTI